MDIAAGRPNEFLTGLSKVSRSSLLASGVHITLAKDQPIFHVGDSSDNVYILMNGRVKIYEVSRDEREIILWFCFPGEIFGLAELVQGSTRAVHAQSCSSVKLLKIRHQDFTAILHKNPDASFRVIELLASRLRELGHVMANLATDDVRSRVIKLLTRLATRYGQMENDEELCIRVSLTHQDMADMIGATRQTVTTVLNALKRTGFLRITNKLIFIKPKIWFHAHRLDELEAIPEISHIRHDQ